MKKYLKFILPSVILIVCGFLILSDAWAAAKSGITISSASKILVPFDILSLRGTNLDTKAATSVIFTEKNGEVYMIPATNVTTTNVQAQIPPVAFSDSKGAFTQQSTSVKVIQMKKNGEKLSVTTSNEITGLTITAPRTPAAFKKSEFKNSPKGTLTKIVLSVSLNSLKSAASGFSDNKALSDSFTKSENGLKDLISSVSSIVKNPKSSVKLKTTTTDTLTIDKNVLTLLDAIYSGYLGMAEKNKLISDNSNSFTLIPRALADDTSDCMKAGLGDPNLSKEEREIYGIVCQPIDSAKEKLPIAGKVAEIGTEIIWSMPQTLGAVALGSSKIILKTAAEIGIASLWPEKLDLMANMKQLVTDTNDVFAKMVDDGMSGITPMLDQVNRLADTYMGDYLRTVDKFGIGGYGDFLYAIFAEPFYTIPNGFHPDARLVQMDNNKRNDKVVVLQSTVPVSSLSLILDSTGTLKGGYDVVSNPNPVHTDNTTPPLLEEDQPEKDCSEPKIDTYHKCQSGCDDINDLIEKSNCSNTCIGNWLKSNCP